MEKRSIVNRCIADLEMAQKVYNRLNGSQATPAGQLRQAAIEAKKLEVQLAAAKLAEAEYYLAALNARLDFLELRCAGPNGATRREREERAGARDARPVNTATVARRAAELDRHQAELGALLSRDAAVTSQVA